MRRIKILQFNAKTYHYLNNQKSIAVGVSGGADSMALVHLLRHQFPNKKLYAITIDHALRPDSEAEAISVTTYLQGLVDYHDILTWNGDKPKQGIQSAARTARFRLFTEALQNHDIGHICLAHHSDDQAETFLHRLAKGSGLDGLSSMKPLTTRQNIVIVRPLLDHSHVDLVKYCQDHDIKWIEDPSNQNETFARVRFRKSRSFLESEGLSNTRITRLCTRLDRTREALNFYTHQAFDAFVTIDESGARIDKKAQELPEDILLRIVIKTAKIINPNETLSSRLERLETLLLEEKSKKFTLSGLVFTRHKDGDITLSLEILS